MPRAKEGESVQTACPGSGCQRCHHLDAVVCTASATVGAARLVGSCLWCRAVCCCAKNSSLGSSTATAASAYGEAFGRSHRCWCKWWHWWDVCAKRRETWSLVYFHWRLSPVSSSIGCSTFGFGPHPRGKSFDVTASNHWIVTV